MTPTSTTKRLCAKPSTTWGYKMHYTIEIQWSDENQKYVVVLPEWEGRYLMPVSSGATYEEAARNGARALELIIEEAKEHGDPLPEPATFEAVS